MHKPINTAIASYGMSGMVFHGPLLRGSGLFKVTKIWERTKDLSRKHFPEAKIVRTYDEILQDEGIELVIVNTPDHTHFQLASQALRAGKHVVVEKPFTQKASEGYELIRQANKAGRLITVFQNRRWDSDFLTVKKIAESQLLGRIVEYEAHFDRYRNYVQDSWKEDPSTGTGTLYNLGPHLIDQALLLFGWPDEIYADLHIRRTHGRIDDAFELKMYYPGFKATLRASYLMREPGPKYQLHGTEGSFVKYGSDNQEELLKKGHSVSCRDMGVEPSDIHGILHTELSGIATRGRVESLRGNYSLFYEQLAEAIRYNKPVPVDPVDALRVIHIIETAFESHKAGKRIPISPLETR